ncbi:MAG: YHS domain-containing protein [archaeon]|nr:YHS domain-containing protein [archaeon]MCP8305564.1 YHS domain-containing protein [archaeon]
MVCNSPDEPIHTYYFCSELCKAEFERNPKKYTKKYEIAQKYHR